MDWTSLPSQLPRVVIYDSREKRSAVYFGEEISGKKRPKVARDSFCQTTYNIKGFPSNDERLDLFRRNVHSLRLFATEKAQEQQHTRPKKPIC